MNKSSTSANHYQTNMSKRLSKSTVLSIALSAACFFPLSHAVAREASGSQQQERGRMKAAVNIPIKGKVTDKSTGEPLAGVSIKVKGTSLGTSTDGNGMFSFNGPDNGTLVLTYLGFQTLEVPVNNRSTIMIAMDPSATSLTEVVVVGYGTTRKKDLTGSVAVVDAKDFQKGNISTPEQLIAGKVPGISITSNGGQPGAGSTIRIRGGSSLNASNDPLIVIDGVPLENSNISGASNPLSFINPNDVASFTVLKDASAAAIYGARASNGVIIITTKTGSSSAFKLNFNTVNSVSTNYNEVDVLNADEFREIVNQYGSADQKARLGSERTDWQKEIYRTGFSSDNNLSFGGGIRKLPYRLSLGYQTQQGVLLTDKLEKTTVGLVLNPRFFDDHLKVDLNVKGSSQRARFANTAAIGGALTFDPTHAVMTNSERFGGYFEHLDPSQPTGLYNLQGRNPVGLLRQRRDVGKPLRSIGNIQLDYKFHFLPELRANLNLGYDIAKGKGTVYVPDSAASNYLVNGTGGLNNKYKSERKNTLVDFYLNYVKEIASIKSRVDLTAGYSYNDYLTKTYNFASFSARGAQLTADPAFPFDEPHYRLVSYFGRANYNYDDRYLLTATVRRDGSSRFAEDNRYGIFPSLAVAWTASNESFLKDHATISDLKFRVGYGVTGQQDGIDNYGYLASYQLSEPNASYQFGDSYYRMYRPSGYVSSIKWEETTTTNIALDYGFWNQRITGSLEFYQKDTKDLLARVPQAAGTNFSAFAVQNIGDMENRGVEFNISAQMIKKTDFSWDLAFNITRNKNKITNLTLVPNDPNYIGAPTGAISGGVGGGFVQLHPVGASKNTFFLYQQVYDDAGKPIDGVYVDRNQDGVISQEDLYLSKRADPTVFMGLSSNLNYKKWNAGVVFRANIGNYVYNNNFSQTGTLKQLTGSAVSYNASRDYLSTGFEGSAFQILSDYYLQNASFLKLDNVSVGYQAGRIFNGAASLQINAIAQNVFVITKYKGLDPEVPSGIDNNLYPRPRVFSLGLNVSF